MATNGITYTTAAYILTSRWQLMASRTRPWLIYLHQDGNLWNHVEDRGLYTYIKMATYGIT